MLVTVAICLALLEGENCSQKDASTILRQEIPRSNFQVCMKTGLELVHDWARAKKLDADASFFILCEPQQGI